MGFICTCYREPPHVFRSLVIIQARSSSVALRYVVDKSKLLNMKPQWQFWAHNHVLSLYFYRGRKITFQKRTLRKRCPNINVKSSSFCLKHLREADSLTTLVNFQVSYLIYLSLQGYPRATHSQFSQWITLINWVNLRICKLIWDTKSVRRITDAPLVLIWLRSIQTVFC